MRGFTPLKRNCPICNGTRSDCRQSQETGIVHCRADLNSLPTGWKFIKDDAWGFGMYAQTSEETNSQQWQQRQQERSIQRQRELEELRRGAMPEAQRDRAIRRIHSHFGLSPKHRQNLRDRGLSDTHINRFPYFSFIPNQPLPPLIPANLPGVRWGRLSVAESGMSCPIPNIDGLIIGWQSRFDNSSEGKYRWPRGKKSVHLPNGELPIGVYRPDGAVTRRAIGHSEGFLKADIIAQTWELPTLGAASANFVASSQQWKSSLERLAAEFLTRQIDWFADAGAVSNPHITSQYIKAWEQLRAWGYSVQVIWWGQIDKSAGDADEISADVRASSLERISTDEYIAIAHDYGGFWEQPPESDRVINQDEWELKHGFGKQIRTFIAHALRQCRGLVQSPLARPQQLKEPPDETFTHANQRLQRWQVLVENNYKYILDRSAPGLGKSYSAGVALPAAFNAEKLWYISNDHRNPTTSVIQSNYTDLPVRHNGLKIDNSRHTPNGNPFQVWPTPGERPDTKGNCLRTDLFQKFRAKNLNVEASETSPICQTCKLAHLCKQGKGFKYGATFRGDRKNALKNNRIRAHADSMPQSYEFDYSQSGLFWDEAGIQLKAMNEVTASLSDFDQVWAELEAKAPSLHETLKPLRLALRPLLTGELKQPYHGWDDGAIRSLLPQVPDNLGDIIQVLEEILQPDLSFLEQEADSISTSSARQLGISSRSQQLVNRQFRRVTHQEISTGFQQLALNWLIPFLRVWNGERGAIRCESHKLTIYSQCNRHAALARAAKFNIFLDATITRERLALLLGINPEEIYVIEQETPNHNNLRIIQITGMGKLGKDRSGSLKQRVAALRKGLERWHPDIVFGDWKTHAKNGDGQWFVNLRGSNEFEDAPAMAVFGVPYQNLGHLQALYQTLTGEAAPLDKDNPHPGLQRFIEAYTQAEIEQAIGRLRSHLRPREQLIFYFVGDYDLSFLGVPVEQIEAFQIAPEAGTSAQITRWKILEAIRSLQNQQQKITQITIATTASISQSLIAKVASQFGGWGNFKKLLLALLNPLSNDSNNFASLTDEEKWLAQCYLPTLLNDPPETVVEHIRAVVQAFGFRGFRAIVAATSPNTQARLLALVMQALPLEVQSQLLAPWLKT